MISLHVTAVAALVSWKVNTDINILYTHLLGNAYRIDTYRREEKERGKKEKGKQNGNGKGKKREGKGKEKLKQKEKLGCDTVLK